MRHSRRFVLISGEGAFVIPSFTGSYSLFGDAKKGYIELYSSGTLTSSTSATVDIFAVGGGKNGSSGGMRYYSGGGGKAGANFTLLKQKLSSGEYTITIASATGNTSFGDIQTTSATGVGTPGAGVGTEGSFSQKNGLPGSAGDYPFGDSTFSMVQGTGGSGGIGGGKGGAGGSGGGGAGGTGDTYSSSRNGKPGTTNTGGGGGGAGNSGGNHGTGGSGGSGLVIVRWGDWSDVA